MGKRFYGKHADKDQAMRLANKYAKGYKKGKCYTPASRIPNSCTFDAATGLWTCMAKAHHHWGSCGSYELTSRGGKEWEVDIPVITWDQQGRAAPAGESAQQEIKEDEYTDASPEDYDDNEEET